MRSDQQTFRPRGWARHLAANVSPMSAAAGQLAFERDAGLRLRRARDAARDRIAQRRRPTRARMRALSVAPGGRIAWKDVPAPPQPGPGAALVHPIAVATCDLDRALVLGQTPFQMPLHVGHECVAEVVETGEGVTSVGPGDRVVLPFQINCGECAPCRAGHTSNCLRVPPLSMYGFGFGGGHWGGVLADLVAVPFAEGMLVPLPAGVDPAHAASAADNIADAHRHVAPHLAGLRERGQGDEVLIVGSLERRSVFSASVPLYAGQIALALGASRVRYVDARPALREHAARLGLEALAPRELDKRELAPLVIESSATPPGLQLALKMTAPDGICSSVGSLHVTTKIPTGLMYVRNVTFHIGRSNARHEIPGVLELIASGRIRPAEVTTMLADLDDAPRALRTHVCTEATKTIFAER